MAAHLCLSIRFLDGTFHGRRDGGETEWPPSPLRMFQALVAAAARRNAGQPGLGAHSALEWLERLPPPIIIAPESAPGSGYRLSVPNNAMDVVTKAWARGNESNTGDANPATHRTMKPVRPTLFADDGAHYLWDVPEPAGDELQGHVEALARAAGDVVALGWGLDLVVGRAVVLSDRQVEGLPGVRWLPGRAAGRGGLRIPIPGSLEGVMKHHADFLNRIGPDGFVPPPMLSTYRKVEYRRATEPAARPIAAFRLLQPDASSFRAFDSARQGLRVTGMMRGAVKAAAIRSGWAEEKIASFVLGHGQGNGAVGPKRFAYFPLPSIEAREGGQSLVAGSVRRVMVSSFGDDCDAEIAWAQRMVSGQELKEEGTELPVALLSLIPADEKVVQRYTRPSATWATVTPVVLPGYDDPRHYRRRLQDGVGVEEQRDLLTRLEARIAGLLRKAIGQAGYSEALADHADIEWQSAGFWPGAERVDRYGVPDHLKRFARYHVRIRWRDAAGQEVQIRGPICLGGGRYYGLGLFAGL